MKSESRTLIHLFERKNVEFISAKTARQTFQHLPEIKLFFTSKVSKTGKFLREQILDKLTKQNIFHK